MSIIQVQNLKKEFGKKIAVFNLSFDVYEGEIFALLGTNGAGKSTTMEIITKMINSTSGSVNIFGKNINTNWNEISPKINIVPQENAISDNLNVRQNLELFYDLYNLDKKQKGEILDKLILDFELTEFAKIKAKKLSGGLKRRLSIAVALITQPKILILDEPTTGLDVISRKLLWKQLLSHKEKNKMTIIITTHYLEEAAEYADRVAIMHNSYLKIIDTVENMLEKTKTSSFDDAFIKITEGI
ncbi:ABC transporter ATP-binding protein [Spiroplasma taiwanense]|uniref:ABC transporter ATP-binding protein n=1 Tax=Spiroplasma taiwanense CT-1 TaxID=1276220 RepID=S5MBS5_9MOLU|nr:ABC transporter ATP-binding protein [Spiroplasma taiwanense]AGR41208.1 ABC transporter ATP-binding protein [Spiroplasma taiwanense CT-1]